GQEEVALVHLLEVELVQLVNIGLQFGVHIIVLLLISNLLLHRIRTGAHVGAGLRLSASSCHASRPPRRRISRTTAAKPIRGCAPPWAFASAPVLSAC